MHKQKKKEEEIGKWGKGHTQTHIHIYTPMKEQVTTRFCSDGEVARNSVHGCDARSRKVECRAGGEGSLKR